MLSDNYENLLRPARRAKKKHMGVFAVAEFENVRFVLHDFAFEGERPEYEFSMVLLGARGARKHLGNPLRIPVKLVEAAQESARAAGLDEVDTQVRVIAWILARGRIGQRLEAAGGCPPEFRKLFEQHKQAWREKAALEEAVGPPHAATAAPRQLRM